MLTVSRVATEGVIWVAIGWLILATAYVSLGHLATVVRWLGAEGPSVWFLAGVPDALAGVSAVFVRSTDRLSRWLGWVGFEFAAQVGHVHAQVVGVFGVVGAPDFGEQLALREYAACVGGQVG